MNGLRTMPFRFGGLFVILPVIAGCSSFRTDMGQPLPAKPPNFINGQTRVTTAMEELGAPYAVGKLPNGFAFLYEYSQTGEFQLGFSLDLPLIRYLKFVHAANHLDHQILLLTFDDHGILQSAGSSQWQENLGGGSGVQIVFAVMSLSDTSVYLRPADAHDWGGQLLQPPEITLNAAETLRTGENGLQQRTVPDYAGQQTLEMAVPKSEREKKKIKGNYQSQ